MSLILLDIQEQKDIELVTSKGNKISNYQVFDISQFEKNQFNSYTGEKYPFTIFRSSPSPMYNCHGMSFASRRTNIDNANEIRKILNDDGYKKIDKNQTIPGDIVLYIVAENGEISHSGVLVFCEHPVDGISIIKVVSKWGKYKEAVHNLYESPYQNCIHEFYRLSHDEYEV